jgi:ethanolamine utilization cobalamin adenosyltransferase
MPQFHAGETKLHFHCCHDIGLPTGIPGDRAAECNTGYGLPVVECRDMKKKREDKTCLSGHRFVSKNHGRIAFRGMIDSLEADVLEAQVTAAGLGAEWYCASLGEMLGALRKILAAEVRERPLTPFGLFGLSLEELHRQSQDPEGVFGFPHPLPEFSMGPLALRLNTLRTRIREGELLAVKVLRRRIDIITVMNRLSSALYWLFCRCLADQRKDRNAQGPKRSEAAHTPG